MPHINWLILAWSKFGHHYHVQMKSGLMVCLHLKKMTKYSSPFPADSAFDGHGSYCVCVCVRACACGWFYANTKRRNFIAINILHQFVCSVRSHVSEW
jgi:hypothetical protein